MAKEPRKPASRLKRTVSLRGAVGVAADGDADGVRRRRSEQASIGAREPASRSAWARRPSMRPNWSTRTAPAPAIATAASPTVARSERPTWAASDAGVGLLLLADDRLDRGDGAVGELDLDHEGAEFAQRLLEPDPLFSIRRSRASRSASTISLAPTEPNSLPSSPARWWIVSTVFESRPAASASRSARTLLGPLGRLEAALGFLERARGRRLGQLARDQVVAQVAGGDVDRPGRARRATRRPGAGWPAPSALSDVRQQGDFARPLHRHRELALVTAGKSGDPTAAGLPLVGEEAAQQVQVLVVDGVGVDARVLARPGAIGASPAATACPLKSCLLF